MELRYQNIIPINHPEVKALLGKVVKELVEETFNKLLDAEADELVKGSLHERSAKRVETRAGYYKRNLETGAGKVRLKAPKLRKIPFESVIIERYKRRELFVEYTLMEMYLAGIFARRFEDITEALWGTRVSAGSISRPNQQVYMK